MRDGDVTAALVVSALALAFALCVWPGPARVRAGDLSGYWASRRAGSLHEIVPGAAGAGRAFAVGVGPGLQAPGRVRGLRSVHIAGLGGAPARRGVVGPGKRDIRWADGDTWTRQGVAWRRGARA